MRRLVRRRWALAPLLLLLVVAVVEGLARVRWTASDTYFVEKNTIYRPDPLLFWTLHPGQTQTLEGTEYRSNSLGMRDAEPPPKTDRRRVLLMGESSTMGVGVAHEKIYASILGKELGAQWEVLNAGIGAWTLWQSWVRLAWNGEALAPDVVMAYHQANDYLPAGQIDRNNPLYFLPGTDRQIYESRRDWAPVLRLLESSRAWRMAQKSQTLKRSKEGSTPTLRVPDPDRRLAWQSMARWCADHQAQLWVVVPLYDSNRIDPVLRATAALPGVKLLDLPALAEAQGLTRRSLLLDGVHPNADGHAWIGKMLAEALQNVQ